MDSAWEQKKPKSEIYCPDCPTICVDWHWAGVDFAWEQEKLKATKMLENAAESHASGSIIKSGHGRSMSGRSAETVVQQDRHVHSSGEPEQLQGLEDRILAWAQLHYTKRRQE
jgi:hypothetical protein